MPGTWARPAPGTRSRRTPRCCVPARPCSLEGRLCPERPREIGAGALRSRPLRLRLRRSRPAPTTRGSSGGGDENPFHMRWRHRHDRARVVQTGCNRNTEIPQSNFEHVAGRIWVCSRPSWIFGALFSVSGCVRGVGSAREESADLRASIPATLRHAPSRVGRRRGSLGLTPPQPRLVSQAETRRAHIRRA